MHKCNDCNNFSITVHYGIHYCQWHYDIIKDSATSSYNDGERLKHGSMVYLERQLFMDISFKLAERNKKLNAELTKAKNRFADYRAEYQKPWYKRFFHLGRVK